MPHYANVTFDISVPLDNQEIMDICAAIEEQLQLMGFKEPRVRIVVGPQVDKHAKSVE